MSAMDIDSVPTPATGHPAQIKVIFTTTDADLELPEAKRQLLVPAGPCFPALVQSAAVVDVVLLLLVQLCLSSFSSAY